MDILITEQIGGDDVDRLKERFSVVTHPEGWKNLGSISADLETCRALIVRNQTKVTKEVIESAKNLQVIGRAGAGLDNIDVRSASEAGVVVVSTPDQNSLSVAELSIGFMVALARKIVPADRSTKSGQWSRHQFSGSELFGKTLGVIGMGRIGFLTARRARAMGMQILAHDRYVSPDAPSLIETRAELVELADLLARSDFVSCHLPSTPETHHLFNYERFCQMKSSAFFLNLSRGEVVDEAGLLRALNEKRVAGAALDVREVEPPEESGLSAMDNVILTPHIAAFTREAQDRVNRAVASDVASVLDGAKPLNFVNFPTPARAKPRESLH